MKTFFFFFFGEHLRLCPWSLALASSISVLGLESVCPRKGCPWPWPWPRIFFVSLALALASSLVSSTPPLLFIKTAKCQILAWLLSEVESRTQGSRLRPRTQKNQRPRTAFPRTDPFEAKDRNARVQGPRTQPQVFSKKTKSLQKSFSGNLPFIGVARIFDWGGTQTTNHMQ